MFLVCGEALFDFFLETDDGPAAAGFAARAGGSPFNVAIGLARLGQASGLLTGLSSDLLGQRLAQVLSDEGVSTAYAIPTDRPTTVSLVGLDTAGVPAYQFYDTGSADTGVIEADLPALGPRFERHPMFPDRANVSFAEVRATDAIRLRVWERGAGATLACGSAACASRYRSRCR